MRTLLAIVTNEVLIRQYPPHFYSKMTKVLTTLFLLFTLICLASDNLELGIPGKADQIVDREGYVLGYCEAWEQPRWVTYRLTAEEVTSQKTKRIDNFQPDPAIRTGSATLEDYRGSGYDRGHMAPAADMKWSRAAMEECFYLSNMCPQDRSNNAGIWNEIENTVRGFACSEGSVFIVTGPVVGRNPKTIGPNKVAVPDGFYKVVYDETPPCKMIAFYVPNRSMPGKPADYACTVDRIEEMTGLDFFSKLPQQTQASLESNIDLRAWNMSKSQKANPQTAQQRQPSPDNGAQLPAIRKEYRAGSQMPVGSRVAAPVCEDWPETGYWLSTNSNKRHNKKCENYRKTRGYPCKKNEGQPCGKCGG